MAAQAGRVTNYFELFLELVFALAPPNGERAGVRGIDFVPPHPSPLPQLPLAEREKKFRAEPGRVTKFLNLFFTERARPRAQQCSPARPPDSFWGAGARTTLLCPGTGALRRPPSAFFIHPSAFPPGARPQGLSQRDKIIQPRVDRQRRATLGHRSNEPTTRKGLDRGRWLGFNPGRVVGIGFDYLG